jgi:hypothetical protein
MNYLQVVQYFRRIPGGSIYDPRRHWCSEFVLELREKHRPDIGLKFGAVVALQEFREGSDPKKAASEWSKRSAGAR